MNILKTLGLGAYYRMRRISKAMKNWKKFGVIIFGSLFLAAQMAPALVQAQALVPSDGSFRVAMFPTHSEINLGGNQVYSAQGFYGIGEVTGQTTFNWTASKGGITVASSAGNTWNFRPTEAGTYTINARGVYNGQFAFANDPGTLIVNGVENSQYLVSIVQGAGSNTISLGGSQAYSGKAMLDTDTVTDESTFGWVVTRDNQTVHTAPGNSFVYTPTAVGTYKVKVNGLHTPSQKTAWSDEATLIVTDDTPGNLPPVADFTNANANLCVTFDGSTSYDSDGTITSYAWSFGDGTNGSGVTVQNCYTTAGTYTVTLTVTDDDGAIGTKTRSIPVESLVPTFCTLTIVGANSQPIPNNVVNLSLVNGTASAQFNVIARDQNGNNITSTVQNITWIPAGVGTISPSHGSSTTYTTQVPGGANLVALADNCQGSLGVGINTTQAPTDQKSMTRVVITPDPGIGLVGSNIPFSAQAYYLNTQNQEVVFTPSDNVIYNWTLNQPTIGGLNGNVNQKTATGQNVSFISYANTPATTYTNFLMVEAVYGVQHANDLTSVQLTSNNICNPVYDITASPDPASVNAGGLVTIVATATDGCNNINNISNFTWTVLDGNAGSIYSQSGNTIVWRGGNIDGTFHNAVRVSNGFAYEDVTIIVSGSNIITVQDYYLDYTLRGVIEDGSSPSEGDVIVYTLRLTNNRQSTLHDVEATVDVPTYTSFLSATSAHGTPRLAGRTISWNAGTIYSNDSKTMTFRVTINRDLPNHQLAITAYGDADSDETPSFNIVSNTIYVSGDKERPYVPSPVCTPYNCKGLPNTGTDFWAWIAIAVVSAGLAYIVYRAVSRENA